MQVGSENRAKLWLAVALVIVAAALLARWLFSSGDAPSVAATTTAPAEVAEAPSARPRTPSAHKAGGKKLSTAPRSLDPTLRYDLLKQSEDTEYKGVGRNIFQAQVDIPKPIFPAHKPKPGPPPPPPGPPPPPPIDLKFFGFASKPGEPKRIFLSQGEDVFIASEGDIVDRRYKILRISPMSVEVEDVLNNNRQEIFLTQGQG